MKKQEETKKFNVYLPTGENMKVFGNYIEIRETGQIVIYSDMSTRVDKIKAVLPPLTVVVLAD